MTVLAVVLSGCSGGGDDGNDGGEAQGGREQPTNPGSSASEPPLLETTATIGNVEGRFATDRRSRVKTAVTEVVDAWLDAAYVTGDFPRTDFDDAFPGFSSGARDDARSDAGLMSNQAIGDRVESVQATKRRLRIDVLATGKKAVGVTARFVLLMDLELDSGSDAERSERVAGSLFMTWRQGGWQVFGYDVKRGLA
ncbi:MAG: hypothetical protein WKF79_02095 [Nocardioides sp.]